jgi:1-acyl-sn-glycerol-3-phosphate acyltransferase
MIQDLIVLLARAITGAGVRWVGCAPSTRQRIYFANHTSHLDALVLWASLPGEVRALARPVAARDYWSVGRLRPYLATRVFNAVLIERLKVTAHDNPIEQLITALGDQHSLIIFPEGGRQSGPEMAEFKSGLYHLARKRPDLELIPVLIDNANRILPKGEFLPVPFVCSLSFGAPVALASGEGKAEFLSRARDAVMQLRAPS